MVKVPGVVTHRWLIGFNQWNDHIQGFGRKSREKQNPTSMYYMLQMNTNRRLLGTEDRFFFFFFFNQALKFIYLFNKFLCIALSCLMFAH